jgi:hypothetical protein
MTSQRIYGICFPRVCVSLELCDRTFYVNKRFVGGSTRAFNATAITDVM